MIQHLYHFLKLTFTLNMYFFLTFSLFKTLIRVYLLHGRNIFKCYFQNIMFRKCNVENYYLRIFTLP